MAEVPQKKHLQPNLSKYLKSKHLLMLPYLEGSSFEKISGDGSDISANWRENESLKLQRITRTLDAFQHYVVPKSHGQLLIADYKAISWLVNSSVAN